MTDNLIEIWLEEGYRYMVVEEMNGHSEFKVLCNTKEEADATVFELYGPEFGLTDEPNYPEFVNHIDETDKRIVSIFELVKCKWKGYK